MMVRHFKLHRNGNELIEELTSESTENTDELEITVNAINRETEGDEMNSDETFASDPVQDTRYTRLLESQN